MLPVMSAGATDGHFLRNAGIPTYGHSGLTSDVDDSRRCRRSRYCRLDASEGRL